jgi:hypothetical protein
LLGSQNQAPRVKRELSDLFAISAVMASWLDSDNGSGFSLDILPYGVFSTEERDKRIGMAIGDHILDLKMLYREDMLSSITFDGSVLESDTLNDFAALGRTASEEVRQSVRKFLDENTIFGPELRDDQQRRAKVLVKISSATMHLPMRIGGYTDFFVGLYHAENVRSKVGIPKYIMRLTRHSVLIFFALEKAFHPISTVCQLLTTVVLLL